MLTAKMVNEIHQDILPTLMKWRQSYDASLSESTALSTTNDAITDMHACMH